MVDAPVASSKQLQKEEEDLLATYNSITGLLLRMLPIITMHGTSILIMVVNFLSIKVLTPMPGQ